MTDVATLEQEATSLTTEATVLAVTDAASFARAGAFLQGIAMYIKRVGDVLDPIVESAHRAHKVAVQQRDALLAPAKSAKAILGSRMATWEQEQARLRREAEDRAQRERERLEREAREQAVAEQRRLQQEAETRRLEEAAQLEAGGDTAGAERLISEPVAPPIVVAPAPVFAPQPMVAAPPRVDGVAFRSDWKAEVVDLLALVRAVAAGQQPITLLLPNQVAVNQMARAMKGAMRIPGVKVIESRVTSVRS